MSFFQDDEEKLISLFDKRISLTYVSASSDLYSIKYQMGYIADIMGIDDIGNSSTTLDFLAFCKTNGSAGITQDGEHDVGYFIQCASDFTNLKGSITWRLDSIPSEITRSTSEFNSYYERVEELYSNTSINVNAIEEHRECSDVLDEAMDVVGIYETIADLAVNITRSDTITEAYPYAIQISSLLKMANVLFTKEKVKEIDNNATQKCKWLRQLKYKNKHVDEDEYEQDFLKLDELTINTERLYRSVTPLFKSLNNELSNKISIFTRKGQEYLDQRITKSKLAQEFASKHFLKYREKVGDLTDDLQPLIKDYNEELTVTMEKLKEIYKKIFGFWSSHD